MDQREGEVESWREWLRRHGAALLLLARQHCASAGDAEDAVQEGFVRFWRKRERAEDATAYLFACVRSAAIDLTRSGRRRGRHEARVDPPHGAMFDPAEHDELRAAIEAALATLPAEQREVVVLRIWGELTFAQTAAALAINADTAASRYRYALARLREASALRRQRQEATE